MSHVPSLTDAKPTDTNPDNLLAMPSPLLHILSRELCVPLTAILGWSEWLSERVGDTQQQQEGLRHIRSAAGKMLCLLDDYSSLAQLGNEEEPASTTMALPVAVERVCSGLEPLARQRRQQLRVELNDQFPHVTVAFWFQQVLWLVIRYMLRLAPEGATVVVVCEPTARALHLVISSEGDSQESLMAPSGLNLARLLVRRLGGKLVVESTEAGCRVLIELPTAPQVAAPPVPVTAPPALPPAAHVSSVAPPPTASARKVLVIDDDENLLKLLGAVMLAAGYQPYLVTDGVQGLAVARHFSPDVVLLDIGMPGMDGFATFNALRVEPHLAHAKIVALTAYTSTSERERIARHGFDGFIPKPFKREQLIQIVSELSA